PRWARAGDSVVRDPSRPPPGRTAAPSRVDRARRCRCRTAPTPRAGLRRTTTGSGASCRHAPRPVAGATVRRDPPADRGCPAESGADWHSRGQACASRRLATASGQALTALHARARGCTMPVQTQRRDAAMERIDLSRDIQGVPIPAGHTVLLEKGTEVYIT